MKCVVLGGAGFLGSHLTDTLLAAGHEVRVFDRPNVTRAKTLMQSHEAEWVEGDFLNKKDLAAALAGCDLVYHLVDGIEYRVLRLANPYGEGQRPTSGQGIVTVCLEKVLRGEPIEIWGDGRVVRDYLYVGDAMEAFLKVTFYSGVHRVFNIGSGQGKSVLEVL